MLKRAGLGVCMNMHMGPDGRSEGKEVGVGGWLEKFLKIIIFFAVGELDERSHKSCNEKTGNSFSRISTCQGSKSVAGELLRVEFECNEPSVCVHVFLESDSSFVQYPNTQPSEESNSLYSLPLTGPAYFFVLVLFLFFINFFLQILAFRVLSTFNFLHASLTSCVPYRLLQSSALNTKRILSQFGHRQCETTSLLQPQLQVA